MYLEISGYKKIMGGELLFADVDISMAQGEIITLLGDSGVGKSTFLRMLAGVERVEDGAFVLDGVDMHGVPKGKRPISIMFQEALLFPHLSVIDNVCFPLKCRGIDKKRRYARGYELLEKMRLTDLKSRRPHELSGGQKQRAALARAIISAPKLLLLDEPFASLDLKLSRELRAWMKGVIKENGITAIFVTHSQEDALIMSPRVFIMRGTRVTESASRDIDEFFGEGAYIDGAFVPMSELELSRENGVPVEITGTMKLHGENFILFRLENQERIIKAPANWDGATFFIRRKEI